MTTKRGITRWNLRDLTGARLGIYGRASQDKGGQEKSVTDQVGEGIAWAERNQCLVAETYSADNNRSASRFARRARADFDRMLEDVAQDKLDGLWFWELSRSQRRLDVYASLRDLCRAKGVFWIVSGRAYDLNDYMDLQALGFAAVNSETESEMISDRVRRGQSSSAAAGRPHGPLNYGYRRVYDGRGRYVEQVPDDALREATGTDGTVSWFSPAGVVGEIISRIAKGVGNKTIARDLTRRGIPTPRGKVRWHETSVRSLATNLVYIGSRVRHGEAVDIGEPCWPALIDEVTFYAAQNVLGDPKRANTRPSRARHLLSHVATCARCGAVVHAGPNYSPPQYFCSSANRCAFVHMDPLDDYADEQMRVYLSRRDVLEDLKRAEGGDAEVILARAEAERLRGELEKWRRLSETGEADAVTATRSINGLKVKIAEAEDRADQCSMPPVLRGHVGTGAMAWADIEDIATKREILRGCAEIRIRPVGKSRRRVPVEDRVTWRWLIGPDQAEVEQEEPYAPKTAAERDAMFEQQARVIFAADLDAGTVPTLNALQSALRIGRPRTRRIRAALVARGEGAKA